ncbi:hypothetical protein NFI96_029828 [Prochilodus magdalenae]|nr:hypothetical protein NFI96_029828 [Prochilodus magdalenae]
MFPGETSAQTIDPLVGEVQLPEGDDLTLSCNYTSRNTGDVLQWYRQSPGSSPEFLLYIDLYGSKSDPPPRMSAVVDNVLKRVDLKISSVAVSDSMLYYCALRPTVTGNRDTLYRNLPVFLFTSLCVFGADVIRQSDDQETDVSRTEGEPLTLKCSYETSSQYVLLYWYRQYPNRAPQYLLYRGARGRSDSDTSDSRFSSTTARTSTDLTVEALRPSDTALYYCALRDVGAQVLLLGLNEMGLFLEVCRLKLLKFLWPSESCVSQSISPLEEKVDAVEGETVTLSCRYQYSGAVYLHWYRQYPGSRPEFLLRIDPDNNDVRHADPPFPRLDAAVKGSIVDLKISSAAVSDSVLYYCALRPTVTRSPSTLYKNSLTDKALRCVWGFLSDVQLSTCSQSNSGGLNLDNNSVLSSRKGGGDNRSLPTARNQNEGPSPGLIAFHRKGYDGSVQTLYWYRQYPGTRPEYLLTIVPGSDAVSLGRLKAEVDKNLNRVDLKISSAAVPDSVLYYCALRPTVTGNPDTLYRNWFYD